MKILEHYQRIFENLRACLGMVFFSRFVDKPILWFLGRTRWGNSAFTKHCLRIQSAGILTHLYHRYKEYSVPVSDNCRLYAEALSGST